MKALALENYAFVLDISYSKYNHGKMLLNRDKARLLPKTDEEAGTLSVLSYTDSPKKNENTLHGNKYKKVTPRNDIKAPNDNNHVQKNKKTPLLGED